MHPKVAAAGVGAGVAEALITIAAWVCEMHGFTIPEGVQGAFGTLLGTALAVWAGWATPSRQATDPSVPKPPTV